MVLSACSRIRGSISNGHSTLKELTAPCAPTYASCVDVEDDIVVVGVVHEVKVTSQVEIQWPFIPLPSSDLHIF